MIRGYRYKLKPTKAQREFFESNFGCSRFVYNHFLNLRKEAWETSEKSLTYVNTAKLLSDLKKNDEYIWLKDADSMALQESLKDLDRAYVNFFKKTANYPRFHSKNHNYQSYRTRNQKDCIRFEETNKIRLPKIGLVRIRGKFRPNGRILNATISRTPTNKYFVSIIYEVVEEALKTNGGGVIGIDVGLKHFYTDSNGETVDNPKAYRKFEKKLAREQRRLSRKQKGSNNRQKQRIRVAKTHEKIVNLRKDFLHKQTSMLANENQVVCVEDLNIKGMLKNRSLAKSISDVSWSEFFRQLEYKTEERGGVVVKVPTFYPSSQTCSDCGYKNPLVKDLKVRKWECPKCGVIHDRDMNASLNILSKGLEILENSIVGHTETGELCSQNACGDCVSLDASQAVINEARNPRP